MIELFDFFVEFGQIFLSWNQSDQAIHKTPPNFVDDVHRRMTNWIWVYRWIHFSFNERCQILSEKMDHHHHLGVREIFSAPTRRNESKRKKERIVWQLSSACVCLCFCEEIVGGASVCEMWKRCRCVGARAMTVISDLWSFVDTRRSLFPTTVRTDQRVKVVARRMKEGMENVFNLGKRKRSRMRPSERREQERCVICENWNDVIARDETVFVGEKETTNFSKI